LLLLFRKMCGVGRMRVGRADCYVPFGEFISVYIFDLYYIKILETVANIVTTEVKGDIMREMLCYGIMNNALL
jgi:hypothetical protein